MSEANKALVRRVMEAYAAADDAALDELLTENYTQHTRLGPGREPVKQRARELLRAFPDLHCQIDLLIAEGDLVAAYQTVTGTHRGTFQGIAPTGRPVSFEVIDIWRVDGGRLAEHWAVLDQLGLLRQLGMTVAPAGAGPEG